MALERVMGPAPVAVVQYGDFLLCAWPSGDQIAKMRYMSGGKLRVPLVLRAPVGDSGRGALHGSNLEALFLNVPGLKSCAGHGLDARIAESRIRDDIPVLVFVPSCCMGPKGARASGQCGASSEIPPRLRGSHRQGMSGAKAGCDHPATLVMMHRALGRGATGRERNQRGSDRTRGAWCRSTGIWWARRWRKPTVWWW
jgi:hypothetical protein